VGLHLLCGDVPAAGAWRLLDDVALIRLEDRDWALQDLHALAGDAALAEHAAVVLGWAYAIAGDRQAASVVLARVPPPRAAAIEAFAAIDDAGAFATW